MLFRSPEMLKLDSVTKVKVLFLVLVYVFNIHLFEFSAAILEKGPVAYFLFIREIIISALKKKIALFPLFSR